MDLSDSFISIPHNGQESKPFSDSTFCFHQKYNHGDDDDFLGFWFPIGQEIFIEFAQPFQESNHGMSKLLRLLDLVGKRGKTKKKRISGSK